MRETFDLLRHERRARIFFLALAQSALGTGAGYIALLLIAESRFGSAWAVSLILIADLVPAMLLGPLFGAAADRWSRKRCAIVGDVLRVVAFAGIALVDGFGATVALALVAGVGTGLFTPAGLAALPSVLDDKRRIPAATSLYGVVADLGFTVGPALAAAVLLLGGPETLILVNAATFALSGLLLAPLRFGAAPAHAPEGARPSLVAEARDGLRATAGMPAIRIVLVASAGALFCAGMFNIAELFFAKEDIGTTNTGFGVLVACFGVGFVAGSLAGSKGGMAPQLKRRFTTGVLVLGIGFLATGLTGSFAIALVTFAVAGFGNGLLVVFERLLIQHAFPDSLVARVFGIRDALTAWAFAIAFLVAGALVTEIGPSAVIAIGGGVCIAVYAATALALRNRWTDPADGGHLAAAATTSGPPAVVAGDPALRR
jgi:MFS family permease